MQFLWNIRLLSCIVYTWNTQKTFIITGLPNPIHYLFIGVLQMDTKLSAIYDSYTNGQKEQMVEQIKEYGQTRFVLDLYNQLNFTGNPKAEYAAIVYTFFLLK